MSKTNGNTDTPKVKVATMWLDACAGCHMSILDIDEKLIPLLDKIEFVYGPLVDIKEIPEDVDVGIIEGAIANEHDLHLAKDMRKKSKLIISLGDCAVNSNVPSLRNPWYVREALDRSYIENAQHNPQHPKNGVPRLLAYARPVHEHIKVDLFIPGCPPPADAIYQAIAGLLEGNIPEEFTLSRFGK